MKPVCLRLAAVSVITQQAEPALLDKRTHACAVLLVFLARKDFVTHPQSDSASTSKATNSNLTSLSGGACINQSQSSLVEYWRSPYFA